MKTKRNSTKSKVQTFSISPELLGAAKERVSKTIYAKSFSSWIAMLVRKELDSEAGGVITEADENTVRRMVEQGARARKNAPEPDRSRY